MTRASITIRNVQLDSATARLAGGSLRIYSGAQPTGPEYPAQGTLIVVMPLPIQAFRLAYGGTAEAESIAPAYAVADGVAGFFRLFDRDTYAIYDGAISDLFGSGEMKLQNTKINAGDQVRVTSLTLTLPA